MSVAWAGREVARPVFGPRICDWTNEEVGPEHKLILEAKNGVQVQTLVSTFSCSSFRSEGCLQKT